MEISEQKKKSGVFYLTHRNVMIISVAFLACLLFMWIKYPKYFSVGNLLTIVNSIPASAILALGFTFVLIVGGIDLSCGYGVTLCIIVMGVALQNGASPIQGCLIAVGTGTAIGLVNSILVVYTGIPPFVVTLATMSACQGLVNLWYPIRVRVKTGIFHTIGYGTILGGFPVATVIMIVCFLFLLLLLKNTKVGIYTYAVGANEKYSHLAGINVRLYKAIPYIICGVCMGIAGVILSSRIALVQKTTGGNGLLMDVVTAAVLGGNGTAGEGGVTGTLIGVVLLQMLSSALVLMNVSGDGQDIVKGVLIITGLIFINRMNQKR